MTQARERAPVPRVRAGWLFDRRWDAVVIGSGVGGLVCAALLGQSGLSVLVLEKHYEIGGLSQCFSRRGYHFDTGVHYLGDLGPGAPLFGLLERLCPGELSYAALPPRYERIRGGDVRADLGGDRAALREALHALAPDEGAAIDRYLDEVHACARAAPAFFLDRIRERHDEPTRSPFFHWSDRTTVEALEGFGLSRRLSGIVAYAWGNYACPPDRSSFAAHAVQVAHYTSQGAFYPRGGGQAVPDALGRAVVRAGGAVVVRAGVREVMLEGGRATGVVLEDGREIAAPLVIGATGAETALSLVKSDALDGLRERLRRVGPSSAHVALYLGLRGSASELGLDGSNLWLGESVASIVDEGLGSRWVEGARSSPPGVFVSFGSVNDPDFLRRHPGRTAVEATVVLPRAPFDGWAGTAHARRPDGYEALKARLASQLLALVFSERPELEGAVEHVELSTPLTTEHFTGYRRGEACGLDHAPLRFRAGPWPHTPVPGLFLTGQDVWLCGVAGAAFGGVLTASAILKRDLAREVLRPGGA